MTSETGRWHPWPSSKLGWWSFGLGAGGFVYTMFLGMWIAPLVPEPIRPLTGIALIAILLAGIVLGWIAIFRKDRSLVLLVVLSIVTVFAVTFGIGEALIPH